MTTSLPSTLTHSCSVEYFKSAGDVIGLVLRSGAGSGRDLTGGAPADAGPARPGAGPVSRRARPSSGRSGAWRSVLGDPAGVVVGELGGGGRVGALGEHPHH